MGSFAIRLPRVLHEIAARAIQIHGSIGITTAMPVLGQTARFFVWDI